jgi:hypothetical protein
MCRDAAERGGAGARDGAESKLKKLRGGGDGEVSRDEVEKVYRQCKAAQDENKELKKKLEQVSGAGALAHVEAPPLLDLPCTCIVCRALDLSAAGSSASRVAATLLGRLPPPACQPCASARF